jgi:cytochrome c oxidase subunit 3
MPEAVAAHFEDRTKQAHAARLGVWVFLASELLFFAGLFVLYGAYRSEHSAGFGQGVAHNTLTLGSINTCVLLVSSYTVALAVHRLREGQLRACAALIASTVALGGGFLVIKGFEYAHHFAEGIYPGGTGEFFRAHPDPGTKMFFTLYYGMTGLHALHVLVGMGVLSFLFVRVVRRTGARDAKYPVADYPVALGAVYWHLVDLIWIFLWPLFYLVPGAAR